MYYGACVLCPLVIKNVSGIPEKTMLVKDSIDDKVNYLYIFYYGSLHALVMMVLTNKILGKAVIVFKELHGF